MDYGKYSHKDSKTNRTDDSKASVVRFAMFPPQSRCLSLEEASLGEGRITHERTEQETKRVRRLFSNIMAFYFPKLFYSQITSICTGQTL